MTKFEQLLRQAKGDLVVWEALIDEIVQHNKEDLAWIKSEEGSRILCEALNLAPAEISAEMDAKLDGLGLLPKVKFVDDDGNPVFTLGQLVEATGMPLEKLRQDIQALDAVRPIRILTGSEIHRLC